MTFIWIIRKSRLSTDVIFVVANQINDVILTCSYNFMWEGRWRCLNVKWSWKKENESWREYSIKNSQSIYDWDTFQTFGNFSAFWQHFLQPLKAGRAFLWEEFNSITKKKRLAQIVKHIIAQSQCELLHYSGGAVGALWLSLLSSASASLQPGHKLLGCLILQVGAHVAGVGTVCMASD